GSCRRRAPCHALRRGRGRLPDCVRAGADPGVHWLIKAPVKQKKRKNRPPKSLEGFWRAVFFYCGGRKTLVGCASAFLNLLAAQVLDFNGEHSHRCARCGDFSVGG